jgi:hypothetical protein
MDALLIEEIARMLREELRTLHAEIRETFSKSAFPLPFVPAPEVQATADDECFSEHVPQFAWDTTTSMSCIDESVPPPPFVPTPEVKVVDDDEHRLFTDGTEAVACATTVSDVAPNERGLTTNSSPARGIPAGNTVDCNLIPKSHATANNLVTKSSPPQQSSPCGSTPTRLDPGRCARSSVDLVVGAPHLDPHSELYNAIGKHNTATDVGIHSFRLGLNRFADFTNKEY